MKTDGVDGGPDVKELIELYERCSPVVHGWDRLTENERVRYNIWEGQSADGKKWDENMPDGQSAFPWNGASDARIPLADEVVNDLVDLLTEAFWRSVARVEGVESGDTERSSYATRLIEWVKGTKLYPELVREIELHAQNGQTYGPSILQVVWERELGYKRQTVKLEELRAAAGDVGETMVQLILDPSMEDQAVDLVRRLYEEYVESKRPQNFEWTPRPLSRRRATEIVRSLRETGEAKVAVPYLCKNQPCITALKLWEDIFIPVETTDLQSARVIFVKEWMTEADFQAAGAADGWDPEWMAQALKHKGEFSTWSARTEDTKPISLSAEFGWISGERKDLIEVLYAYERKADDEGVVGVYYTVLHAKVGSGDRDEDLFGKHELLDYPHNKYPFTVYRREVPQRQLCATRGVPQIVATWQREVKVQHDAITDQTSLGVVPPIMTYNLMGTDYKFGPGVQVPVAAPGREPRFMAIPDRGAVVAFELMDRVERQTDRYFGRARADLPPAPGVIKQQKQVRAFLLSCSEAFQQMFQLMQKFMDPSEFARITGSEEALALSEDEIERMYDYILTFDVQELSQEFAMAKLKAISENILPEDAAGIIDRAKLTMMKLRAIDPSLAKELVSSESSASQQLFRKVQTDFAMMFLGNPPEFVENDPTAPMQLQFGQQIVASNQKYQQALQADEQFRELVKKWAKNMQFSISQEQNKQVGRIGVQA